jgi:putative redox protein
MFASKIMNTSKVIYLGELRTNAQHLQSQNTIVTDAPIDNQGKGEAFSPTDLAATSLASCMLTVIGIYAQANGIEMKGSEATVKKIMSSDAPRRIVQIDVFVNIITEHPLDEKHRTIFERTAHTCPVAKSLHPDIFQNIKLSFKSVSEA